MKWENREEREMKVKKKNRPAARLPPAFCNGAKCEREDLLFPSPKTHHKREGGQPLPVGCRRRSRHDRRRRMAGLHHLLRGPAAALGPAPPLPPCLRPRLPRPLVRLFLPLSSSSSVPFRSSNVWLDPGLSFRSPTRAAWSNGWSTARAERRSEPAPSASRPAAPRTRRPASTSSPPARARPRRDPPRRRIPPGDPTGRRSPTRSPAWSRRRRPSAGSSRSSGTASRTSMPRRAPLMSFSPDLCCVSRGLLRGYRCFFWSGCQVDGEGSLCGGVAGSREEGERLCQDAAPCENRGN